MQWYCEEKLRVDHSFLCFVGVPALTSRNFKEADFVKVVEYLDRGVKIALEAQSATGKKVQVCCERTVPIHRKKKDGGCTFYHNASRS